MAPANENNREKTAVLLDRRAALAGLLAAPLLAPRARAQSSPSASGFPTRPVRLIVGFAAGGAADSVARVVAPGLGERLGGTVVVENRTGGSGTAAGAVVAQAAPDGHTLLFDASSHLVNPTLMRGLAFDYETAFRPVSLVATFPQALAVKADSPARTLQDFVRMARERPGTLNVGTQGNATAGHLALVRLQRLAGIEVTHAAYRGGADAARDLAAGTLDAVLITALSAGTAVDAGRGRFLAVATEGRLEARPEVPTFAEAGVPDLTIAEWCALFAPAATPAAVADQLHAALAATVAQPEVRERLARLVALPVASSPAEFATFVRDGRESMAALVREANIRLE